MWPKFFHPLSVRFSSGPSHYPALFLCNPLSSCVLGSLLLCRLPLCLRRLPEDVSACVSHTLDTQKLSPSQYIPHPRAGDGQGGSVGELQQGIKGIWCHAVQLAHAETSSTLATPLLCPKQLAEIETDCSHD